MNAKTVFSTALLLTALTFSAARGQTPSMYGPMDTAPPPTGGGIGDTQAPAPQAGQQFQLSSWIRGDEYDCCCPCIASSGPIKAELYFRSGPSIPFGNGTLVDVLQTGFSVEGGLRTLFFDQSCCNAWDVDLGVTNVYNHAHAPSNYSGIPLNLLVPPGVSVTTGANGVPGVTVEALNRTSLDLGGGHEWYLWGSAGCGGSVWRVGCDGGGRYGSESCDFNEIPHRTDVFGGIWASAHTDVEIPCGCCTFLAGFRLEYGYTWSSILQIQNKSDVQDLAILFSIGVRF